MTSFLFPPLSLHLWLPAGVMSAMMSVVRRSAMRGYGATAARLTPDQKVGSSNLSALILPTRRTQGCGLQILWQRALEPPRSHFSRNARRIGK